MNIIKKFISSRFRLGVAIYLIAMAVIITVGLIIFYNFIAAYEKTLPGHEAEKFVSGLSFDYLSGLIEDCSPYGGSGELVKEKCREALKNKNIEFRKNVRKYTDENPVYILSVNDDDFCDITFTQDKKYSFGFFTWKIKKAEIFPDFYNQFVYSVLVIAPAGSVVEVDGIQAGEDNIESEFIFNDKLTEFESRLTDKYYYLSYRFNGLIDLINIKATLDGEELSLTSHEENNYVFEYPDDYTEDYEITVPTGSVLLLNGIQAGEKYIKEIIEQPEKLGIFEKGLGLTETVYLIPKLFGPPIIEAEYEKIKLDMLSESNENIIYFDMPRETRYNINIMLPERAVLEINGIAAPDEYLTVSADGNEKFAELVKFAGDINIKSYSVNNLYLNPKIDVYMDAGTPVLSKREEGNRIYYEYKISASEQNAAPIKDISERFIRDYIYYTAQGYTNIDANHAKVMGYALSGASVSSTLRRSYDAVKWNSSYSSIIYNELTVDNIIYYNDNLYSSNVKFNIDMQKYGSSRNYSDTFEIFFVKYAGSWYVADINFGFEDENK